MSNDMILSRIGEANALLIACKDAPSAKKVVDMAHAAEVYAKRQKLSEETVNYAHAIKVDACRLLGEFLSKRDKNTGSMGIGKKCPEPEQGHSIPKLEEDGINYDESSLSKFLFGLGESKPEVYEKVRNNEVTITEARRQQRREQATNKAAVMPKGKYRVIYADPPWKYGDSRGGLDGTTGASAHYESMSITELCALPVVDIADKEAVLFLWVPSPLLFESAYVIDAWRFQYKASFVWNKVKHNLGHYNSVRHEFLLVCTRGSCLPDVNILIPSVQTIERTERHSEKPKEFRGIIDRLYPVGNRIELFARTKTEGWDTYGNDANA